MSIASFSGSAISSTYQRIVQTDGLYLGDGTGSLINNLALPGNLYVTGSGSFTSGVIITGSLNISGSQNYNGNINLNGSLVVTSSAVGQSILGTGLIVNNNNGSTSISDFEVKTQLYDAIYVSSSLNSLLLMSNVNGKVGFFGATPNTQSLGWNATNAQVTKSFDADTITLAQLADVVGTLIIELKAKGLLG